MGKDTCGYYFSTQFKTLTNGSYLLGYSNVRQGQAKKCTKVFSDDALVIVEYSNCGTLALSADFDESMLTILEQQ